MYCLLLCSCFVHPLIHVHSRVLIYTWKSRCICSASGLRVLRSTYCWPPFTYLISSSPSPSPVFPLSPLSLSLLPSQFLCPPTSWVRGHQQRSHTTRVSAEMEGNSAPTSLASVHTLIHSHHTHTYTHTHTNTHTHTHTHTHTRTHTQLTREVGTGFYLFDTHTLLTFQSHGLKSQIKSSWLPHALFALCCCTYIQVREGCSSLWEGCRLCMSVEDTMQRDSMKTRQNRRRW